MTKPYKATQIRVDMSAARLYLFLNVVLNIQKWLCFPKYKNECNSFVKVQNFDKASQS